MKKPQSPVMCSVIVPGTPSSRPAGSVILAAAMDGLEARTRGLQHRFQLAEHALGLRGVVGGVVADVDVDRDEAGFGPRVDGKMRFGEQHRAGDALRLELEEIV